MAQSTLRQFYTVRKRPQEDHGSLKRRKLTEESRLDIPVLDKCSDPLSLPFTQPVKISTTVSGSEKSHSNSTRRSSTRSKARHQTKAPNTRRLCRVPPSKQATHTLCPSSTTALEKSPSECDTPANETTPTASPGEAPLLSSHPLTSRRASSSSGRDEHTTTAGSQRQSSSTHEEDTLLLPSSPKTPKRDESSSCQQSSAAESTATTIPPTRSRKNLAARMKLASNDPHASSLHAPPTSHGTLTSSSLVKSPPRSGSAPSKSVCNLSAKALAQHTTSENKTLVKPSSNVGPDASLSDSTSTTSSSIRRLRGMSVRELAQETEPEKRMSARVARRNKGKSPATPTSRAPQLHQFKAFVVQSPTKSPSKQPAYQRYHPLARSEAPAPDLPLPYKYQVLLEKFRCTDTVVTMLQKRREICSFNKLKQAVEEMTRRKYENRNLGQMETVYPRAFVFRQEKNIPGVYDRKTYESYQLTVECNVREDGGSEGGSKEEEKADKSNAVLDSSALLRRKKVFNKNLCEITRQHHKQFLSSLNPPLDIPDEKVLRWHPAFPLDTVPDIEEADLPKPPLTESYTTARDVLSVAHERLAPRVQRALEGVAKSSEEVGGGQAREEKGGGSSIDAQMNPALRGVSLKLLEKIQQKEASHVKSAITRDPDKEKKLEMLARLPALCSIIRSFFVTEKKAAIAWDSVVQKLSESHSSSLPSDRVEEHLQFMEESLGGWLRVVKVRKKRFVKIIKNTDTHILTARMEDTRKKLLA